MKTVSLLLTRAAALAVAAWLGALGLFATEIAPPGSSFDEAWQEYEALAKTRPPAGVSREEAIAAMNVRSRRLTRLAWDMFEGYPKEPRRWQAAVEIIRTTYGYIYEINGDPQKDGPGVFQRDADARDTWGIYARALYDRILAKPELPAETVKAAIDAYLSRLNMTPNSRSAEQRAVIDEFARRFPDDPKLVLYEKRYYLTLEQDDPGAAAELLASLLQSPHADLRALAEGKVRIQDARTEAMQLAFIAADGREVDLARLRGKVVLVDFWATWCGPCIAELPNIKKVYAEYHAKGFEIIGIALENGKLASGDTPEQAETKLAAAKKVLTDFTVKNDLPWPQHFDGRYWKNEIAVRYSINSIPAMFLLDQNGKVVSTQARGEKLEAEVKRLLKL